MFLKGQCIFGFRHQAFYKISFCFNVTTIIHTENKKALTALKNDVKALMEKDRYELLMQINEDDNKVNIYHCIHKEQSAVVMQVEEEEGVTVMVFSGKFTLEDVMKMTQ